MAFYVSRINVFVNNADSESLRTAEQDQTEALAALNRIYAERHMGTEQELERFFTSRLGADKILKGPEREEKKQFTDEARKKFLRLLARQESIRKNAENELNRANVPLAQATRHNAGFINPDAPDALDTAKTMLTDKTEAREKKWLEQYLRLAEKMEKDPEAFDIHQSDEKLVDHYLKYYDLFYLGEDNSIELKRLWEKYGQTLPAEQQEQYPKLQQKVAELADIYTIFMTRLNIIMSPSYAYLGNSDLSLEDRKNLLNTLANGDEVNFLNADNEPEILHEVEELQSDARDNVNAEFRLSLERGIEQKIGLAPQILSTESGTDVDDPTSALYDSDKNHYFKSFYMRSHDGQGEWYHCEIQNDLSVKEELVPEEQQNEISALYAIRKARQPLVTNTMQTLFRLDREKKIVMSPDGTESRLVGQFGVEELWTRLYRDRKVFYRDAQQQLHAITLDTNSIKEYVLTVEEERKLQDFLNRDEKVTYGPDRIRRIPPHANVIQAFTQMLDGGSFSYKKPDLNRVVFRLDENGRLAEEIIDALTWVHMRADQAQQMLVDSQVEYDMNGEVPGYLTQELENPGNFAASMSEDAGDRLEELNNATSFGRSSDNYRNVQTAVEDLKKNSSAMSREELRDALKSIAGLAQIYLNGKDPDAERTEYEQTRYDLMVNIRDRFEQHAADLETMEKAGCRIRPQTAQMSAKTREVLQKNLRRSMRHVPFSAERFSAWKSLVNLDGKAAVSTEERELERNKVRKSEAVRFMEKALGDDSVESEKLLNRYYETAAKAFEQLAAAKASQYADFTAIYNRVKSRGLHDFSTGDADFDRDLHNEMMKQLSVEALRRDLDLGPDREIRNTPNAPKMNFHTQRLMAKLTGWEDPEDQITLEQDMDEAQRNSNNNLAEAMFGVDYKKASELFGKFDINTNLRQIPMTFMVTGLMTWGLTPEEIMDPEARLDEKGEFGRLIIENVNSPEPKKTEFFRCLKRNVMENSLDFLNYANGIEQQANNPQAKNRNDALLNFAAKAMFFSSGFHDTVAQYLIKDVDRWSASKIGGYEAVFRRPDESIDDFKDRVDDVYAVSQTFRNHFGKTHERVKSEAKLANFLNHGKGDADDSLRTLFEKNVTVPAAMQIDPKTTEQRFSLLKFIFGDTINHFGDKVYENLLNKNFSAVEKELLLMDPNLQNKIRIEFNSDFILKPPAPGMTDRCRAMKEKRFAQVILTNNQGKTRSLSLKLLSGQGPESPEEKEFLEGFANEIHTYAAGKIEETEFEMREERIDMCNVIPEAFAEYRRLCLAYGEETEELKTALEKYADHMKKGSLKDSDYADYLIIGEEKASGLLKREAERLNIDYQKLDPEAKTMLLSGICVAALKNNRQITMVSDKLIERNGDSLGAPANINALKLTADYGRKTIETSELADSIWNRVTDGIKKAASPEQQKAIHDKAVHEAEVSAKQKTDEWVIRKKNFDKIFYMNEETTRSILRSAKDFSGEIRRIAANAANAPVNAANAQANAANAPVNAQANVPVNAPVNAAANAAAVPAFNFRNKMKLAAPTAILAIAYAISPKRKQDGHSYLTAGKKITTPLTPQDREVLQAASVKYLELLKNSRQNPKQAETQMRQYVAYGLNIMHGAPENSEALDIKDYTKKYAGAIAAHNELIAFIASDQAPAEIGRDKAGKQKPLGAVLRDNNVIISTDRDLAAGNLFYMAQEANQLYQGHDIAGHLENLKRTQNAQIFLEHQLTENTKQLDTAAIVKSKKACADFVTEMKNTKAYKYPPVNPKQEGGWTRDVSMSLKKLQENQNHSDNIYNQITRKLNDPNRINNAPQLRQ